MNDPGRRRVEPVVEPVYGTTGSTMCDGSDGVQYTRCIAFMKSAAYP
jgi:hypothetical protein